MNCDGVVISTSINDNFAEGVIAGALINLSCGGLSDGDGVSTATATDIDIGISLAVMASDIDGVSASSSINIDIRLATIICLICGYMDFVVVIATAYIDIGNAA